MVKDTVETLRHKKTQRLYILIDDQQKEFYSVVDPAGKQCRLGVQHFEEETLFLAEDDAEFEQLSPEQLSYVREYNERAALSAEHEISQKTKEAGSAPVKRASPSPRASKAKAAPKTHTPYYAQPVSWNAARLCFYRHKIQPLAPRQLFKINVENVGTFEMTKEEFLLAFNDVIMAPSYRSEGIFTYPEVPEKAFRFLKPPA